MRAAGKRLLKELQPLDDLIGGVDVERCAVALGQALDRELASAQGSAGKRARR